MTDTTWRATTDAATIYQDQIVPALMEEWAPRVAEAADIRPGERVLGEALLVARIEAGRPEWGVDMDESLLSQEVDMDRLEAISFTKGCYPGQETVARVHYRGHVNRHLRGLRLTEFAVPPVGTDLHDADDEVMGTVKSGAVSSRSGAIALALVRREVEPGTILRAKWGGRAIDSTVASLPFPV